MTTPPAPPPVADGGSPDDPYEGVPERPVVLVVLRDDGSGTVNGQPVDIPSGADRHAVLMTQACRIAVTLGHPVRVTACDAHTEWDLVAHPDGDVVPVGRGRRRPSVEPRGFVPEAEAPSSRGPVPRKASTPAPDHPPGAPPRVSPPPTGREVASAVRTAARVGGPTPGGPRPGGTRAGGTRAGGTRAGGPGLAAGRRSATRPGAVVWSSSPPRAVHPPGLPLVCCSPPWR